MQTLARMASAPCVYYTTQNFSEEVDKAGNYTRKAQDDKVYAKISPRLASGSVTDHDFQYAFYIRLNNNHIINPMTIHSLPEDPSTRVDKICKSDVRWQEVPQYLFNKYLLFLKNPSQAGYDDVVRHISDK
jgi:hypothetical protein